MTTKQRGGGVKGLSGRTTKKNNFEKKINNSTLFPLRAYLTGKPNQTLGNSSYCYFYVMAYT